MIKNRAFCRKKEEWKLYIVKIGNLYHKNGTVIVIKNSLYIMEKPIFHFLVTSSVLHHTNLRVLKENSLRSHSELWSNSAELLLRCCYRS